ncbi:4'-phosphopantetheinyl transferase family protein [Streptomyces microflavus]|uniref:4'-phosphopantetheinyl transferase family protein n=1 Tax=Streptomyces microflavus TaxID=1919 RepID=UPI0034512890
MPPLPTAPVGPPAGPPDRTRPPGRPSGRHTLLAGLDDRLRLDPERPLLVHRAPGPLTFAVVSIAWLRALDPGALEHLADTRLHPSECAVHRGLALPKRRSEWLAGRLAVKYAVADHLRRDDRGTRHDTSGPHEIVVHAVPDGPRAGKPFVREPVHIGLSHSLDYAIAVGGSHPLGIDLEGRPMGPHVARMLAVPGGRQAPAGLRRVAGMPLRLRWACREAVVKYTGVAGREALHQTRVTDWQPDGTFHWSPGASLLRHSHGPDSLPAHGWARQLGIYALAVTWR